MRFQDLIQQKTHEEEPAVKQDEKDDPPPYNHIGLTVDPGIVKRVKNFTHSTRAANERKWKLEMMLFPSVTALPESPYKDDAGWSARLTVNTDDISSLMKSGFRLSEDTVKKSKGHIVIDHESQSECRARSKPRHTRKYVFEGRASHVKWKASLSVYAYKVGELSRFRVESLSAHNVGAAVATDRQGNTVYHFSVVSPDDSFNAIYDDMPMEGLWPWPRARMPGRDLSGRDLLERFKKWKAR